MITTIRETTTANGITIRLGKTTGLQNTYYVINALNKEMFSSRQLKTVTIKDVNKAHKIVSSLIDQAQSGIDFWALKFTPQL